MPPGSDWNGCSPDGSETHSGAPRAATRANDELNGRAPVRISRIMRDVRGAGPGVRCEQCGRIRAATDGVLSARTPEDDGGHSVPRLRGSLPSGRIGTM